MRWREENFLRLMPGANYAKGNTPGSLEAYAKHMPGSHPENALERAFSLQI